MGITAARQRLPCRLSVVPLALFVLMVMADQLDLQLIYRYLLGSLSARTWDDVTGLWPWLLVAVPVGAVAGGA